MFRLNVVRWFGSSAAALAVVACGLGVSAGGTRAQDVPTAPSIQDALVSTPDLPARPAPSGCPQLDARLAQLMASADPEAAAASSGLDYQEGTERVIVELAGGSIPDTDAYQLVIEGQSANLLQVRVPTDQLCALASDPAVVRVRPPFAAVPDERRETQDDE